MLTVSTPAPPPDQSYVVRQKDGTTVRYLGRVHFSMSNADRVNVNSLPRGEN